LFLNSNVFGNFATAARLSAGLNSHFGVPLFASLFALVCMGCRSYRYNFGMGLNYQQLLKNVPMGAGGN